MSTYRDKREARAERLREWSAKRADKADTAHTTADAMASVIPFGQPILVGHYSEGRDRRYRARIGANMDKALEHGRKADEMAAKADEIERQAARAIYDDDPDAIERLGVKLAELEAQRERYKAHNKAARAAGDEALPRYVLANLGGTITRTRDRIKRLTAAAERQAAGIKAPARMMAARFASDCAECGARIEKGDTIHYRRAERSATCDNCEKGATE